MKRLEAVAFAAQLNDNDQNDWAYWARDGHQRKDEWVVAVTEGNGNYLGTLTERPDLLVGDTVIYQRCEADKGKIVSIGAAECTKRYSIKWFRGDASCEDAKDISRVP